ncbi:MAG: phosphatidylglycerophosphatase A [Acidobacteriota bacterium]|nr:phosphatidylglycerophosphatase A [Acidobacteriota bacterium]MDE3169705.1 phosphatidylglycerophosphatase A [Acidobacteriota bacterium]
MTASAHSTQVSSDPHSAGPPRSRKPRLAILLATACGLGYIPAAPGTFGSLAGLLLALVPFQLLNAAGMSGMQSFAVGGTFVDPLLIIQAGIGIIVALVGVIVSSRAARYWRQKDPQRVVIDEVSGQHLTLLLGAALPFWWRPEVYSWAPHAFGFIAYESPLNWKYLLGGLILFRVFDIWKPFPARHAESLRAGWGIMADDWIAGIYAGLCLWALRGFLL